MHLDIVELEERLTDRWTALITGSFFRLRLFRLQTTLVHQRWLLSRLFTVAQWLQSVLTYKWRPIMNYSLSDYWLLHQNF